ncbi:MAG: carboxypeptidase-like regulatory domain-containing protein [Candidatus Omnitrophota bacterium]|jgi:hypothetical protein
MNKPEPLLTKSPASHLHSMNLVVALLAGVISITGGIYSLKNTFFAEQAVGSLQGIVRDEKIAKPLKLASVEISDLTGAVVNTAATDDNGHYLIESLKTGNYVVKFTAPLHKVETKTIKIEKNLWSSVNVDLVPEVQPAKFSSVESVAPAQQIVQAPYAAPAATYQTAAPAASGYDTTGNTSSAAAVPSTYSQPDSMQDSSSMDSQSSGFRRHPRRRPPGEYEDTSSTSSQGNAIAQVGTQLLQAWMSKKSSNN